MAFCKQPRREEMSNVSSTTGDQHILHSERTPFLELTVFFGRGCATDKLRESPCSAAVWRALIHIFWVHVSCFREARTKPAAGPPCGTLPGYFFRWIKALAWPSRSYILVP